MPISLAHLASPDTSCSYFSGLYNLQCLLSFRPLVDPGGNENVVLFVPQLYSQKLCIIFGKFHTSNRMLYRAIECLRTGTPLDQNVYEGCLWSSVAPLSEASVAEDGMPQKFPDFTRKQWAQTKPLAILS